MYELGAPVGLGVAAAGTLAATGVNTFGVAALAVALTVGGLFALRLHAVRRAKLQRATES